jgi:hypothetical protein
MGSSATTERTGRRRLVASMTAALLALGALGVVVAVDLDRSPDTVASFNAD